MVTAVITESVPACYGVTCPQRAQCRRYTAVEGSDALHYIATCEDGSGERPLFIPISQESAS